MNYRAASREESDQTRLKDILAESCVEIVRSKSVLRRAVPDLPDQEPPGQPVQINPFWMFWKDRLRQFQPETRGLIFEA
jgi:hypothetical protein